MTLFGAVAVFVAAACAGLVLLPPSAVQRRLALVVPGRAPEGRAHVRVWRAVGAATGCVLALVLSLATPMGLAALPLLCYSGAMAPAVWHDASAAAAARRSTRAVRVVVERLEALVASGLPAERALAAIAKHASGSATVDACLARAADSYALGAPLFRALRLEAREGSVGELAALAAELERARDLARGSLIVVRDARDRLRAAERTHSLAQASAVEGKLMLVLVLCYLPALMLVVVVPLFLGLLAGLAG